MSTEASVPVDCCAMRDLFQKSLPSVVNVMYEGWNFNSGNYLFITDTK